MGLPVTHGLDTPTSSPLREAESRVEVAPEDEEPPSAASAAPFGDLYGRLVYLSGNHVALVDLATGALQRLPIEVSGSIPELAGMELLTDGRRTVGLSLADDPPTAVLVASSAVVTPAVAPTADYWVVTRPDGTDGAIRIAAWQSYGYLTWRVRAPAGSQLVTAGDSVLLVVPPVGRTFRPTASGFEVASDHRTLAVRGGLRVEQRCDDRLYCTVVAVDGDGVAELPEDFVAELADISVSPDGRWLLNDTSPAWLFDRQTEQLRLLDVGGYGQPLWSGDSTSVAWLTSDRTPTLVVVQSEPPEGDEGLVIVELAGLGADPSPGSSFLLESTLSPR